jgi:Ca2+-binding RTX toxin-like protein
MAASIVPSNFTINIDNPFFTLRPGTTFTYTDEGQDLVDTVTVSRTTKVIAGVVTLAVHDVVAVGGAVVEDTVDWYAQDKQGNVWYFGERTTEFNDDGTVTHEGSWVAGRNGAQPGIIMEADPKVGDTYRQEFAPGVAEDQATVVSLDAQATVDYGRFTHVLDTREFTELEPDVIDHKLYASGVGVVLDTSNDGTNAQLVSIVVNGTEGNDVLTGYAGGDQVSGLGGNDTIDGGLGNDLLSGGPGADLFVFDLSGVSGRETDTITDYRADQNDLIRVEGGTLSHDALVNGTWVVVFKDAGGDSIAIRVPGVQDTDHDHHIFDQLLFG